MEATYCRDLVNQCQKYDYIRFTFADINGVARGKVVPRRSVAKYIEHGLQIYAGVFAFGTSHGIPLGTLEADVVSKGQISCNLIADPSSLHSVSWVTNNEATQQRWKVGEVYCEPYWMESKQPQPAPRSIARTMLNSLDEMGWELLSGTEFEFKIYNNTDPTKRVPLFPGCPYGSILRFSLLEDLIYHLDSNLATAGVNIDNLMTEGSPGQFELILEPTKGIKAADNAFLFKQGVMEMLIKKRYGVSFMAKADSIPGGGNGAHFNFSLWDKSTGKNVFYDESAPDKLSQTAKHWIAGIVKHAAALTALCSPTVNCYRRVHQSWAPDVNDWNYFDRNAFLRVKNEGESGTYMENRVPSSACNPYIAMAATVAAGISGVKHKMSPPVAHDTNATKLPSNLAEAIDALEADTGLAEVLGKDFVKYFVGTKRELDLEKLKGHDVSKFIEEQLAAEIAEYEI